MRVNPDTSHVATWTRFASFTTQGTWSGRWDSNPQPRAPKARARPLRHAPTGSRSRSAWASRFGSAGGIDVHRRLLPPLLAHMLAHAHVLPDCCSMPANQNPGIEHKIAAATRGSRSVAMAVQRTPRSDAAAPLVGRGSRAIRASGGPGDRPRIDGLTSGAMDSPAERRSRPMSKPRLAYARSRGGARPAAAALRAGLIPGGSRASASPMIDYLCHGSNPASDLMPR